MRKYFLFILVALCALGACRRGHERQVARDGVTVVEERSDTQLPTIKDDRQSSKEEWTGSYDETAESHETRHSVEVRHVEDEDAEETVSTSDLLAVRGGRQGRVLRRVGYTTSYNPAWRIPNWTAWHLTRDHATGPYKRKGVSYHEDVEVAEPRATLADYRGSSYDRGHMCPSGDNKWDALAQDQSFLLTNMCPQDHNLNGGDWNDLEMRCRRWAERFGDVYIVAGPIVKSANPETIGENRVVVPDQFFKVVLCTQGTPRALGFIYDNRPGHRKMYEYVVPVDEVERITGLDFFAALPDDVERTVEAHANLDDWR